VSPTRPVRPTQPDYPDRWRLGFSDANGEQSGKGRHLAFELEPIPKIDVFRAVLGQLQQAVARMQPGARLGSERELAQRLDVSRVSVREALRALESMGKVEIRRNSGTFIAKRQLGQALIIDQPAEVDADYIHQLSVAREALECAVVRAVLAKPDADLSEARAVLDTAGKELTGKAKAPGSLDLRFENALSRACANPVLEGLQRAVHEMWIDAWVRLGGGVADAPRLHAEHRSIFAAMEAGDIDVAAQLMAEHVNPVARSYPESVRPNLVTA
jgi:GntR family transcriptional regulator, transcriptional repressor for pyruvate dehydrogenase complex